MTEKLLNSNLLYFIPSRGEFLKIQPGTGDNLSPKDIAEGYTDYVIWNRFRPECLDIDGELPMECVDSGMLLLKVDPAPSNLRIVRQQVANNSISTSQRSAQDDMIEAGMNPTFPIHDVLGKVLNYAYGQIAPGAIPLL